MIRRAMLAVVLCVACKDSVIPEGTIRGTYTLRTVDDKALPFSSTAGDGTVTEIVADSITLMENGIFHEAGGVRVTTNSGTTTSLSANYGSYALQSTSVTLHSDQDGTNRSGQIEGSTMTLLDGSHVMVLKKLQ